jgi:TRAP-type mannitol/chloroaromatic compound transport system permease small subunit
MRYSFDVSSNAWLELQWYLFSAVFLLCGGYALLHGQHVRVDIVSGRFSPKVRAWIDVLGTLFFLLPMAALLVYFSWPVFVRAYTTGEISTNAGGLILWPARLLVPIGFTLLALQGLSELVKKIAYLANALPPLVVSAQPPANIREEDSP